MIILFWTLNIFAANIGIEKVEAEYKSHAVIFAEFQQNTHFAATKVDKKAKGRIWVKRPNQLRWETLEPEPEILVSDGNTFWFYTPPFDKGDRGQVIIKKTKHVQTELLNLILAGEFNQIQKKGHVLVRTATDEVTLTPKKGSAGDLTAIRIQINGSVMKNIFLDYKSGNKSEINLSKVNFPKDTPAGIFKFSPDKNTDIIRE